MLNKLRDVITADKSITPLKENATSVNATEVDWSNSLNVSR